MRIHFVGRDLEHRWPDLDWLNAADVDQVAGRFAGGIDSWILQTYLRLAAPLAAAGFETSVSERLEPGAINIAHRDTLAPLGLGCRDYYIVAVRAERAPVRVARWTIVPNMSSEAGRLAKYLPSWPQPGLVARDRARGSRIRRIGCVGAGPAWTADSSFREALARRGIDLVEAAFDFSTIDLVLACRSDTPTLLRTRSAARLVNAWHAGTPALLGAEPAFHDLRYSALDFIAVRGAGEALGAIDFLRDNPGVYQAMVGNGALRAHTFSAAAVTDRWIAFLHDQVAPDAHSRLRTRPPGMLRRLGSLTALARQNLEARVFELRIALERLPVRLGEVR